MEVFNGWVEQITRLRAENAALIATNRKLLEAATNLIKDLKIRNLGEDLSRPFTIALEAAVTKARGEKPQRDFWPY
jgi:hypothetical protein